MNSTMQWDGYQPCNQKYKQRKHYKSPVNKTDAFSQDKGRKHFGRHSSDSVEYVNKLRIFPRCYKDTHEIIQGNSISQTKLINIPAKTKFRGEKLILAQNEQTLQSLLKQKPLLKYKINHLQKVFNNTTDKIYDNTQQTIQKINLKEKERLQALYLDYQSVEEIGKWEKKLQKTRQKFI